jgi:hypothetical protein
MGKSDADTQSLIGAASKRLDGRYTQSEVEAFLDALPHVCRSAYLRAVLVG